MELLDAIQRSTNPDAFRCFVSALERDGHKYLADNLMRTEERVREDVANRRSNASQVTDSGTTRQAVEENESFASLWSDSEYAFVCCVDQFELLNPLFCNPDFTKNSSLIS